MSLLVGLILCLCVTHCIAYMDLMLLSNTTVGGRCLDGTMAGYYYEAPQYGVSNLWVIYFQGGGSCYTESSCTDRASTSYGSSSNWNAQIVGSSIFSIYKSKNPDFYTGHHVAIPYCTGDLYNGQKIKINESWPFSFYFDGHLVIDNIINDLINKFNLSLATNVVITGSSAGGIGTILNIDFIASKLKAINNNIIIKGISVDGWFFAGNTSDQYLIDPLMPPSDYNKWINKEIGGDTTWYIDANSKIWNSYLHPVCKQDLGDINSWHCTSAHVLYKYLSTPIFIAQNQFDSNQLHSQFNTPYPLELNMNTKGYISYFGENMAHSLMQIGNGNGLFLASCYDHGGGIGYGTKSTTIINGYNTTQIIGDWFWERNEFKHIIIDDCYVNNYYLPCNPTCLDNKTFANIININETQTMNTTPTSTQVTVSTTSSTIMMKESTTTSIITTDISTSTLNLNHDENHYKIHLLLYMIITVNILYIL